MARLDPAQLEAQALDGVLVRGFVLDVGHGHLDVDNWFGGKAGHGRGADVVDSQRRWPECRGQTRADLLEAIRPVEVVGDDLDRVVRAIVTDLTSAGGD